MIDLRNGRTLDLLPPNLRNDIELKAACFALDRLHERIYDRIGRIKIWSALDNIDEDIADYLAAELRTPFYDHELDLDTKRKLIAHTLTWYSRLGSKGAMEEAIKIVIGDVQITEWFEYQSSPFYFKITADGNSFISKDMFEKWIAAINMLKNVRSWLEEFNFKQSFSDELFIGAAVVGDSSAIYIKDKLPGNIAFENDLFVGSAIITDSAVLTLNHRYFENICVNTVVNYGVCLWEISSVELPAAPLREVYT